MCCGYANQDNSSLCNAVKDVKERTLLVSGEVQGVPAVCVWRLSEGVGAKPLLPDSAGVGCLQCCGVSLNSLHLHSGELLCLFNTKWGRKHCKSTFWPMPTSSPHIA